LYRDADHRVVANYHSDDASARAFSVETGVMAQKWDVADFAACQAAVTKLESELGQSTYL
jgi:acetoacetyl-CoA reductase